MKPLYTFFLCIILLVASKTTEAQCVPCELGTTTFVVDLSSNPDTNWTISSTRSGLCCGATGSTNCIRFEVTVHPSTNEIGFNVQNPSPPGGAFYQVDCGTPTSLGTPLCVTGSNSFCISFCKSGGDAPTYTISASQSFAASPDVAINSNCMTDISVSGLDESTIQWNSIAPGNPGDYNGYLSCTSLCDTTLVTPQPGYPPFIDFEVSGTPVGCAAGTSRDTVRVYINEGVVATINPNPAFVCFGSADAVITANGVGGAPPYSYLWSTGATTQSTTVAAGTYWVEITDTSANCPAATDTVVVTNSGGPITVSAGTDQIVCSTSPDVVLSGAVTEALGGVWTGGGGSFSPNDSVLNAVYTPSAAEISAGTVTLTLSSYGNGGCTGATDDIVVTIQQAPVVNAGLDAGVCQGEVVILGGTVTGGSGTGQWTSSGTGTFSPSDTDLNATYTPSAADETAGTITITLSATASCAAVSDAMIVTITPQILVVAGVDQVICQGSTAPLGGSISGGTTTGQWTTSGTGTFSPSDADLNATYTPSAADETAGNIVLTLTSTNNGGCSSVSDVITLTIQPGPVVSAGTDVAVCEGETITLSGTVTGGAGTGQWTTSGTGTFSPSNTDLNATYTPSAADASSGSVTITLTSTNSCLTLSDQLIITITPAIIINSGVDQIICEGDVASLSGTVSGGSSTGQWTSSGTGTFSPSNTDLNATYTPSAADALSGSITLTLTSTNNGSCVAISDQLVISITQVPVVDAGADQAICEGELVSLTGSVTVGSTTGIWTSSGTGTFSPSDTDLNATYTASSADATSGTVTLTLTSTAGCQNITDQLVVTITVSPIVNAGVDQSVCANNATTSLAGAVTAGGSAGIWTSSGTGSFSPNDTDLGASYIPSTADTASGTVTLTLTSTDGCIAVSDDVILTISPAPFVNAGTDLIMCANNSIQLSGTVTGITTTGTWSTSGSGTFSPSITDLNAIYTPSSADTIAGSLVLTLTSTNNLNCLPVSDQLNLTITPAPLVNAGLDITVCENNSLVNLAGSVSSGAVTGIWTTSGNGLFNPTNTDLSGTYTPGSVDVLSGSATLTLTSTNNGGCLPVSDQIIVTVTPAPIVSANVDQTVCQNAPDVSLSGSVTGGTTTGQWFTNGSGAFNPSDTDLNAVYSPSAADISAGSVALVLQSTVNGNCNMVSDTMLVTITTAPIVNAGPDVSMCVNNVINLSGSVTGFTTTGSWTTSGTGTFSPNNTDMNVVYIPSAADTTAGSVTVTLTSTNNSSCIAVSDDMQINFTPAPLVNAGTDQTVCANNAIATLNGSVSLGSTSGVWTSTGTGSFTPSDTDLTGNYNLSIADTVSGLVTLILTSTNNGTCLSVSDTTIISVISAPNVDAGVDQFVCLGNSASLSGIITNGSGTGQWSSSGTGSFAPSDTDLNATYIPSLADESSGNINLILISTNNGNCLPESDTLTLTFVTEPTVDAGTDITICSSDTAALNGLVSGSSTTGQWSTSGDGTFLPNTTDLNAVYVPGQNDIINASVTITLESTNSCFNSDQLLITITAGPTVDAGIDQVICVSESQVNLNGIVGGITTTGQWTSSGTGTFSPSNADLNAMYNLTQVDSIAGQFNLILTSTGNGVCSAVSDTVQVTMTTVPLVNAGMDTSFCANNMGILNGSVNGGAATGVWSTLGSGVFSPSNTDLNAVYIPSDADTTTGLVALVLTSTGACVDISDTVAISITPGPLVNAGNDTVICSSSNLQLAGAVSGATFTGQWSTSGDGVFSPSDVDLDAVYSPGSNDLINGSFELYLVSTNIGDCLPLEDTMLVNIQSVPVVDGGGNQIVCSGSSVAISGSVSGGVSGEWTTLGTGTFSSGGISTTYVPSTADTSAGAVQLILTSDPLGLCGQDSDTITVFFENQPIVNAGLDLTVCANNDSVYLNGFTTNGEGVWSTIGDGTFQPSDSLLSTIYIPGANDASFGAVELFLNPTNLQGCPQIEDTLIVTITPAPDVNAGPDISVCLNNLLVSLNGSVSGGSSSGVWSTDGVGTFIPDSLSLGTNYQPASADTTIGSIMFILTSTNNGNCLEQSDTLEVTFDNAPEVDAGPDIIACQGDTIVLTGVINGGGTVIWSTSGSGVFIDSTTNPASYIPSASDTIGPIEMYLQYTNGCGSVVDTSNFTLIPSPGLTVTHTVNCETFEVEFNAQTNSGIIDSLYWDFGDGINDTAQSPIHTYLSDGLYAVSVYVESTDGCSEIFEFNVNIEPMPIAEFIVSDSTVTIGEMIEFTDTSTNAVSWEWDFGDQTGVYFVEDTVYTYSVEGNYTVMLVAYNNSGCSDTAQIQIEVLSDDALMPPAIPNAFTPNGDNVNDILYVRGGPFDTFDLRVYNEWGNEIYKSEDASKGWDGNYRGKAQPVGVYIYTFKGTTADGTEYSLSGDFSLIK